MKPINSCAPLRRGPGAVLAFVLMVASPAARLEAQSSEAADKFWVTDGGVAALAEDGPRVYLGGAFTRVGPRTGSSVRLDAATGNVPAPFPDVHGIVRAVAPDGAGGWFLAGAFDRVGGEFRNNVAHVLADGRLSRWQASVNGPVLALAREPGWLYLGGAFDNVGGFTRHNLARVDTAFGNPDPTWDPDVTGAGGEVRALALGSGVPFAQGLAAVPVLYLGGSFSTLNGGVTRNNAAAVRTADATVSGWNPDLAGDLHALATVGSDVILGGAFTSVNGSAHNRLARVDASGVLQSSWNPDPDGDVHAVASPDGSTVYAGGAFLNIGGQARARVAAIDASGLAVAGFDPGADGDVRALALARSTLYLGGDFTTVASQPRHHLAALDLAGALQGWDPHAFASVLALAFDPRPSGPDWIYAGGVFASVNGVARRNLAAFLKDDGGVDAGFTPEPDAPVQALRVAGGLLYAGGEFGIAGGAGRARLAALDLVTGAATAWNPNVGGGAAPVVQALDVDTAGGMLYAGGSFTLVNGTTSRLNAAAFSLSTGVAGPWNPGPAATVRAVVAVPASSKVELVGDFTQINLPLVPAPYFASVDSTLGVWLPFLPNPDAPVSSLFLNGGSIYLGGEFTQVGLLSQPRSRAGAVDGLAAATAWDPNVSGPRVRALASDGAKVFLGGGFTDVGGATRQNLAQVLLSDASPTGWDPDATGGDVRALLPTAPMVFVGGDFLNASRRPQRGFAVFCKAAIPLDVSATPLGAHTIRVNWTDVGAASYNVYRSAGGGAPYALIGAATSGAGGLTDFAAEGGVTYFYVVRAEQSNCESDASDSASAAATGTCGLAPLFDGAADVVEEAGATCTASVLWNNALGQCGESPTFSVYRSTDPDFRPDAETRFAQGLSAFGWTDTAELLPGVTYYYVVRALDETNGEEDQNLIHVGLRLSSGCTAGVPTPVGALTTRARSGEARVEWTFPLGFGQVELRYEPSASPDTPCSAPPDSTSGTAVPGSPFVGLPGSAAGVDHLVGLPANDFNFCYSAFVQGAGDSEGASTRARPAASPAAVSWAYTTAASALSRPAVMPERAYLGVSNDRRLHAMTTGPTGGVWPTSPSQWTPQSMNAVALGRPTVVELPTTRVAGASRIALVGAQDGRVYCFDAQTGATLWVADGANPLGDGIVAPPSVMVGDFGATPANLVLVATRNSTSANRLVALHLATGAVAWSFDNSGGPGNAIGIVSGQPLVEYGATPRVYFTSRRRAGGSASTVWAVDVSASLGTLAWATDQGEIDGAVTRRGNVLYVGTNLGDVRALRRSDGGQVWSVNFPGGPVKGFVWPDAFSTRLYFSVGDEVRALVDNGGSSAPFWTAPLSAIPNPSTPILNGPTLYVGGGDGRLYSAAADIAGPPPVPTSVLVGDPNVSKTLGAPTFDRGSPATLADDIVVVGTDEGRFYAVHPPF